jgi:hypothetical protein
MKQTSWRVDQLTTTELSAQRTRLECAIATAPENVSELRQQLDAVVGEQQSRERLADSLLDRAMADNPSASAAV